MHDTTITVFNRKKDKKKNVTWYPSIISRCNLTLDKAAVVAKYGSESKDNIVVNVPYSTSSGNIIIDGKIYLPPKEWARADDPTTSVTFADGQESDFIYIGEWDSTDPIDDDDYGTDGFYNHMNNHYDYVFAVTGTALYKVIPHLEVTGA